MRRVVDGCSFADWWHQFRPTHDAIGCLAAAGNVSDASDPKIVHLHGLNLSRAWCWQQLLPELDAELQGIVRSVDRSAPGSVAASRDRMATTSARTGWRRLRCWR